MGLPPEYLIDIAVALRQASYDGPIWSVNSAQLNVNLLRLSTGAGITEHVNSELDVVLIVFEGRGELTIDDQQMLLHAGQAVVIPRGATRSLRCITGPLVYLTCHQRRSGLMPTIRGRDSDR